MKTKLKVKLTLLIALLMQIGLAQEKTVTGTISDETGIPLPGAAVLQKGTSNGVSSDLDGKYSITVNQGDILVFSYIGYADVEVTVGASNVIDVSLNPDNALAPSCTSVSVK